MPINPPPIGKLIPAENGRVDFARVREWALFFHDVTKRANEAELAITQIEADIAAAQANISAIQADLGTAQTDVTQLQADVAAAQSNISTLQSDLATAQSDLATLQAAIDAAEADLATLMPISVGTTIADGEINGLTVTAGTIRTAASGQRIVMNSSGLKMTDGVSELVDFNLGTWKAFIYSLLVDVIEGVNFSFTSGCEITGATSDLTVGRNVDVGGAYQVDGTQVVGNRGSAVADADAGTIVAQFNTLLARLRAHGLIAS